MGISVMPQSIKLLMARGKEDTDANGLADVSIKVPGTFGLNERTIQGGFGIFGNQQPGDYLRIELRDDDDLLGNGPGFVINRFHDDSVPADNQGWYFLSSTLQSTETAPPLELSPLVNDDVTDLPSGMYLHILGQKGDPLVADTLYVNLRWGKRIR